MEIIKYWPFLIVVLLILIVILYFHRFNWSAHNMGFMGYFINYKDL